MRRIYRSICSRRLVNAIRHTRALAVILVTALLVTSLPASAGTNSPAARQPRSIVSQLYSDLGTRLASFGSWVREAVRPKRVASRPYVPIAAYLNPAPPFISEPTNLSVTSASSSGISLSWTAPAGGADHYQVERSESISGPFSFIANASGATYNDASVTNLHAYLYRVRAVSAAGPVSTPSNMAMGTAISFEFQELDNQLIKAQHFHDVRTAINKVRALAGMPDFSWARASLAGLEIKADDMTEMRTALNPALDALFIPLTPYEDPTLTVGLTQILATHLEQLQVRSTRGASTSTGPMDSDSSSARVDPMNQTGGGGENPLSRNFNWNLPLVSLAGRAGMDLGLSLSYNSLVWTKFGASTISFNDDNGFPGPGFRLGFPVIKTSYFNNEVGKNAFLLIGSDGSRTELRQVNTSALYESADSSHILFDTNTLVLSLTDGTQLTYQLLGGEYKCAQIKDRNGNYITISHSPAGRLDTITDTLGRVLTFNYDGTGLLTSITQQWNQSTSNDTHYWARFEYANQTIDINFPGFTVLGTADGASIKTLNRVKLSDNSYFDFTYTSWGQVFKISSYAPDTHLLNYRSYNLPESAGSGHDDCPRFTERRDWAQYWNGNTGLAPVPSEEALTMFEVPVSDTWTMPNNTQQSGMRAQVTAPDGTSNKIYFISSPGWQRGLPALVDTYPSGSSSPARRSMTTWTQDNTTVSYPLNPRVTETNIYDDAGNRARTETTYEQFPFTNGTSCHLPRDFYEYANDENPPNPPTMIRSRRTTYNMTSTYTDRHIFGLVSMQLLYEGNVNTTGVLKSKTGFFYDESGSIQNTASAPEHHDSTYGTNLVAGRGNLTSVKRFDVTSTAEITTVRSKYNIAGALTSSKDALDHETTIGYGDVFSDNGTRTTFAYPTSVTDPDGHSSTAKYHFDFGAVTRRQMPQPNNPNPQLGPEQSFSYDAHGRLLNVTNLANNSYTRFEYPTSNNRVDTYTTITDDFVEAHSFSIADGAGRVIATATDHPGLMNLFSGRRTVYDVMGRVIKTSNPTETAASGTPFQWTSAGNDTGIGWIYTEQTYDWKGRPLVTTNPSTTGNPSETTTTQVSYSGCGCAGGQVATFTDEGTNSLNQTPKKRQQKVYADVLGRIVKREVFNWDGLGPYGTGGTVDTTTITTYNARDQITSIKQYAGTETSSSFQESTLNYDGYGRLSRRHVPEQDAGKFTTWTYNADDTVQTLTDARNATATHSYNGRHLLTGISYSPPPAGIAATANATFGYDGAGNKISMTDGLGSKSYNYDQLSRMTSETRIFTGVGTFTLSYDYNLGNELKKITDASNTTINYNYNVAGKLTGVTGSDTLVANVSTYASGIQYRAWGGLKQASVGTLNSSFSYNARAQVTNFNVSGLANENYDYYDDGRLKFVHNTVNPNFDRVFYYDHVARLTNAFAGGGAHDGGGDIPFSQNFSYNPFGDLDQRETEEWGNGFFADSGTLVNHRRVGWGYDASGRIATIDSRTYTYDAAGRNITLAGQQLTTTSTISSLTESGFDGEGNRVRENSGTSGSMTLKYYLTSSVLGNAVIEELNSSGQKQTGYVYTPGGTLLATQTMSTNVVKFIQASPHNTSEWGALTSGGNTHSEFDAVGAKVRLVNLTPPNRSGDPGTFPVGGNSGYSALENPGAGCTLDGVYMPCYMAMRGVGNASTVDYVDPFFAMTRGRFMRQQWVEEDTSTAVRTGEENILTIYAGPGGHFEYVDDPDDVLEAYNQPQDPVPLPSDLRDRVANRVNNPETDCGELIKKVINEAARLKGKAYSDNPLDVFDRIQGEGGFHLRVQRDSGVAGFTSDGKRLVYINQVSEKNDPRLIKHVQNAYANVALNEIMHHAANGGTYSDRTLARALFNSLNPDEQSANPLPSTGDVRVNGRYFHNFLTGRCPPSIRSNEHEDS